MRVQWLVSGGLATVMVFGASWSEALEPAVTRPAEAPAARSIESAKTTSELMLDTLVAALIQEINETTLENVEEGNQSISLIFDDCNPSMRLVGTLQPLSPTGYPQDQFERTALRAALAGNAYARVDFDQGGFYYRSSIPLSNFAVQCGYCHTNFQGLPPTENVGALMVRIPIDG